MRGRGGGGGGGGGGRGWGGGKKYRNACLTMHQPWASLLVYGIKRVEGRSWPSPITGRLWIHAASKVPDADTIKAMEDFYREIYAVNGITDIKFPEHYPTSRLLGCVEVVGCVKCEELVSWEAVPESVRLEGLTDFCWLCENPQRLLVPFAMRGYQGVYNLEKRIYDAADRGLRPVQGPLPVKFPLPNPQDPFSLKPGSLVRYLNSSTSSAVEKPLSITAAIAGARAAATQFSKKDQIKASTSSSLDCGVNEPGVSSHSIRFEVDSVKGKHAEQQQQSDQAQSITQNQPNARRGDASGAQNEVRKSQLGAPTRLFAAAFRELKFESNR
ncbi:uncharacterized protein LOC109713625 isoform X1 [Ananas comosus]|uniref:Uncharacterized protein LOC109713625 isoform X1 n=1 Tax=Ananas comosus TaxID=4615 RepID=A0A6P5FIW5_ANACO|nr:uncharacterized protein LOC109713625 isoform X1 [Ananas comosus]